MTTIESTTFRARQVGAYLDALGNGTPTPGGGSAAGLAGSLGCSLGRMVCSLTATHGASTELTDLACTFERMGRDLLNLAERDEKAFAHYRSAMSLPRATESDKAARRASIENALIGAAEVPLEMAEIGLEALDTLRLTSSIGTKHALGDLMTGGFLVQAMVLGSIENIEANASAMKTPENRDRFTQAVASVRHDLDARMEALAHAVALRSS